MSTKPKRYRAFISYAHSDKPFATKLHRSLERYRVPAGIDVPLDRSRRLGRIFRDDDEMAASTDLGAAIRGALEDSDNLVVVCSPRAARSRWVNSEIAHFRTANQSDRIFAVIVLGVPASRDHDLECLPPALFESGNSEPLALDSRTEPMARLQARLAAGFLQARFDDLWQRDRRRARRQRHIVAIGALAGFFLTTIAGSLLLERDRRNAFYATAENRLADLRQDPSPERRKAAVRWSLAASPPIGSLIDTLGRQLVCFGQAAKPAGECALREAGFNEAVPTAETKSSFAVFRDLHPTKPLSLSTEISSYGLKVFVEDAKGGGQKFEPLFLKEAIWTAIKKDLRRKVNDTAWFVDLEKFVDRYPAPRWSPDGKFLHVTDSDGSVFVFDGTTGTASFYLAPPGCVVQAQKRTLGLCGPSAIAWDANSKHIAVGWATGDLTIGSLDERRVIRRHGFTFVEKIPPLGPYEESPNAIRILRWSADGKKLLLSNGYLTGEIDAETMAVYNIIQVSKVDPNASIAGIIMGGPPLSLLEWSRTDDAILFGQPDRGVLLWRRDRPRERMRYLFNFMRRPNWFQYDPLLKFIGVDGRGNAAEVFRIGDGYPQQDLVGHENDAPILYLRGHARPVRTMAWSRVGTKIATAADDGSVRLWDAESGALLGVLAHEWSGTESRNAQLQWDQHGQVLTFHASGLSGQSDYTRDATDGTWAQTPFIMSRYERWDLRGLGTLSGSALAQQVCDQVRARNWAVFLAEERAGDPRLQGRPHNACDWRGLRSAAGWGQAALRMLWSIGLADDYRPADGPLHTRYFWWPKGKAAQPKN